MKLAYEFQYFVFRPIVCIMQLSKFPSCGSTFAFLSKGSNVHLYFRANTPKGISSDSVIISFENLKISLTMSKYSLNKISAGVPEMISLDKQITPPFIQFMP